MIIQFYWLSTFRSVLVVAALLWVTAAGLAVAQGPSESTSSQADRDGNDSARQGAGALMREADRRTKTAKTTEDFSDIIRFCEKATEGELSPTAARYFKRLLSWTHNRRGEAYAKKAAEPSEESTGEAAGKFEAQALADFELAVEYDKSRWRAVHNRAVSYALAGKSEKALRDLNLAIKLNPRYPNAWFNRGEVRYVLEQYSEAIDDYNQAIRLKPRDAGAYRSRGHALYRLGRFREAIQDYDQVVRMNPDSAVARVDRGDAYASQSVFEQAATDFREAIRLDDTLGRAYQSAAWLMATCPDDSFRNGALALQSATRAIDLDGKSDYRYLDTMAAAHANAGQFDQAQTLMADAIKAAPEEHVDGLEQRLALYQASTPFRQSR